MNPVVLGHFRTDVITGVPLPIDKMLLRSYKGDIRQISSEGY